MSQPLSRNKLKTAGYFIKRLRDNKFIVLKLFGFFSKDDPRAWTLLVNPGQASVFITCYHNREENGEFLFEFNDGGRFIPKNFSLKTSSLEVIIEYLLTHNVTTDYYPGKNKFIKDVEEIKPIDVSD